MINSGSNTPQDAMTKSWEQFNSTNAEVDQQNQNDAQTKDILTHSEKVTAQSKQSGSTIETVVFDPAKVTDAAIKAIHGKDSISSFKGPA